MGQARGSRLPQYYNVSSEVKLQSELQLSRILTGVAHPESCSTEAEVRHREVRVVKGIQEVSTKLESHSLADREILLQADVGIDVSGANGWALSGAISKCARRGSSERTWTKPLDTLGANRLGVADGAITVGTILGAVSSRGVASRDSERETGTPGNNRCDRPVGDHRIEGPWHVVSKLFAPADGQFIYGVGTDHMRRIPIAARIIASGVIEVLPVIAGRRTLCGRAPGTVIAIVVGHAFLEGIRKLTFQSVAVALLQDHLHGVIVHVADGGGVFHIAESVGTESWRRRGNAVDDRSRRILATDEGIGYGAIRLQITLRQPFGNHQVSCALANVAHLKSRIVGQLALHGEFHWFATAGCTVPVQASIVAPIKGFAAGAATLKAVSVLYAAPVATLLASICGAV